MKRQLEEIIVEVREEQRVKHLTDMAEIFEIADEEEFDEILEASKRNGKPVLVFFGDILYVQCRAINPTFEMIAKERI